ncbi:MAG: hypothetical protein U0Q22_04240 [Acidimicrobiales bacterium]
MTDGSTDSEGRPEAEPEGRPRRRWWRIVALVAVVLICLGAIVVWRASPLPSATWIVTAIRVDGRSVDPAGSTVTTSFGQIAFRGCNEMSSEVGGLPWRPRFGTTSSTLMACLGPRAGLDAIWSRLTTSSVTFDGAWRSAARLRGDGVEVRLRRRDG